MLKGPEHYITFRKDSIDNCVCTLEGYDVFCAKYTYDNENFARISTTKNETLSWNIDSRIVDVSDVTLWIELNDKGSVFMSCAMEGGTVGNGKDRLNSDGQNNKTKENKEFLKKFEKPETPAKPSKAGAVLGKSCCDI